MMTKFQKIRRKVLRYLSFSTALFIFQACYGPPQDMEDDVLIQGIVKSKTTEAPIPGVKVSLESPGQVIYTDADGLFEFYTVIQDLYNLKIEDVDGQENGMYIDGDTTLDAEGTNNFLEIFLDEQ